MEETDCPCLICHQRGRHKMSCPEGECKRSRLTLPMVEVDGKLVPLYTLEARDES